MTLLKVEILTRLNSNPQNPNLTKLRSLYRSILDISFEILPSVASRFAKPNFQLHHPLTMETKQRCMVRRKGGTKEKPTKRKKCKWNMRGSDRTTRRTMSSTGTDCGKGKGCDEVRRETRGRNYTRRAGRFGRMRDTGNLLTFNGEIMRGRDETRFVTKVAWTVDAIVVPLAIQ